MAEPHFTSPWEAAQLSAVTWLLESGIASTATRDANYEVKLVNIADTSSSTALHIAASVGQIEIAGFLLSMSSKLDAQDNDRRTSLHCTVMNSQDIMIALLRARGSDIDAPDQKVPGQSKQGCLLKAAAESLRIETKGAGLLQPSTPLHYACFQGYYYSAILLVKLEAWVNAALEDSMALLMLAVESQTVQLAALLLANGAKVNAATAKACLTPLHCACGAGSLEMTQILVGRGANTKALTISDRPETPASYGVKAALQLM
ncbi:hypothetical protein MMC17_009472 [Xylographa soralifera]|nr:hypothetical protein [Xylographa soralifera]